MRKGEHRKPWEVGGLHGRRHAGAFRNSKGMRPPNYPPSPARATNLPWFPTLSPHLLDGPVLEEEDELMNAPEIITDRLMMRRHLIDDFDASLAMWSDPAVTRYIGGRPSTAEEVWSRLLRYV